MYTTDMSNNVARQPDPRALQAWLDMLSRNEQDGSLFKAIPYLGPESRDGPQQRVRGRRLGGGDDSDQAADSPAVKAAVKDWMRRLCTACALAGGLGGADAEPVKIEVIDSPSWGQQKRLVMIDHQEVRAAQIGWQHCPAAWPTTTTILQ